MKFGQTLRAAQWPPWEEVYIPYKSLKKVLKAGAAGEAGLGATEGSFVAKLCDAVSSVDAFFTAQVGLLTRRLAALRTASQVSGAELAAVSEEMDVLCSGPTVALPAASPLTAASSCHPRPQPVGRC